MKKKLSCNGHTSITEGTCFFLLLESRNSGLCGWGVRNSSQVSAGEAIAPDAPCGLEQLHRHGHGLGLAGLWEWAAWPASLGQGL